MDIIEGVKIDVPSDELKTHLLDRATLHHEKAARYDSQARELQELGDQQGQTNDPVHGLQMKFQEHQRKAELFSFMANHLVPGVTYRLSERDLTYVEIIFEARW